MKDSVKHRNPTATAGPRVLFLALKWGRIGGLEIYNLELVRGLVEAGCVIDVWSVQDGRIHIEHLDGVRVHPLAPRFRPALSLYFRYLWQRLLLRRLQATAEDYDLVIAGHVTVVPVLHQASQSCHWPYWVWTYGIEVWGDWSEDMKEETLAAQRVVSISHFTAHKILEHLPGASISILHNPVDVERFRPAEQDAPHSNPRLLTVGRLSSQERYKGHEVVMQALPLLTQRLGRPVEYYIVGDGDDLQRLKNHAVELGLQEAVRFLGRVPGGDLVRAYQDCDVFVMPSKVERRPDGTWTLLIIGDGPMRPEIERRLAARGLQERVRFAGYVPRSETPPYYRAMDVLVLPSRTTATWAEQFGNVMTEAMLCGVPVIGSDSGSIPSVVGNAALIFPEGDIRALAAQIQRLREDPGLRQTLSDRGRAHALEKYSTTALSHQGYEFYQLLLQR